MTRTAQMSVEHQVLRYEVLRRRGEVEEGAARPVRRGGHQVPVRAHDFGPVLGAVQQHHVGHGGQLVQIQREGGDDAEVSAAAVQGPEELGILVEARVDGAAVRRHQFGGHQVVAGQAEAALQPAGAAAEHEAAHAGGGDPATGGRQAVRLGGPVQIPDEGATADTCRLVGRSDGHAVHAAQVDHQAAVGGRHARDAVAAATDRDLQTVLACKAHGPCHVGLRRALGDHRGPPVDHAVEDRARLVVCRSHRGR